MGPATMEASPSPLRAFLIKLALTEESVSTSTQERVLLDQGKQVKGAQEATMAQQ